MRLGKVSQYYLNLSLLHDQRGLYVLKKAESFNPALMEVERRVQNF